MKVFGVLIFCVLSAHGQSVVVYQDQKIVDLLNEKVAINSSITITDRYKIQIFTGDNINAKTNLYLFKKEYADMDATIVFNTPFYKVWIGNFRNRIEAEKFLKDIKKKYPAAFIIKPNK